MTYRIVISSDIKRQLQTLPGHFKPIARQRIAGLSANPPRERGKWCGSADLGFVNGKRRRKVMYAKTRKEVADKLKTTQYAQASGANLAAERITVRQFLERWLSEIISRQNKPRTVDEDTLCLARAVEFGGESNLCTKPLSVVQ